MTAVVRPPRPFAVSGDRAVPVRVPTAYVGRHRHSDRARHPHVAAATLALMLAWIPNAGLARGRHAPRR